MNNRCSPTIVTGRLVLPELVFEELPMLSVRALNAESGPVMSETISTPAGEFALELPLSAAGPGSTLWLPVMVHLVDGRGTVLGPTGGKLR
jgi:hypothetical protein